MLDETTKDNLEQAIERYVDGLDIATLMYLVSEDLWHYYTTQADGDETQEFIEEMEEL